MTDWDDVRYFMAVAQAGTLSGAARILDVDHATVSRRLSAFETALEVRLVDRLPRSCRLTAIGKRVHERALAMEAGAHSITRLAQSARSPVVNRVVLSAPPAMVGSLFVPRLAGFTAAHPEVLLSISAQGRQVSLSRLEADIAVRLVRPEETGSITRRIGTMTFGLYAHRRYLERVKPAQWRFIAFEPAYSHMPQQQWLLEIVGDRAIACELNYIMEHVIAARAGVGVAGLPRFLGDRERELVRIDDEAPEFSREIWLVAHRDLRKTKPVRAVMEFVVAAIAAEPSLAR